MATLAHRPLSARPMLSHTTSPYSPEPRFVNRQRSFSAVALPHDVSRSMHGYMNLPGGTAGLDSEAQRIWESLMTLHCSRYTPLSTHLARALPLLTHPSLPLPSALQILIFTSSLTPSLRALILSQHPHLTTLDEAVGAARLAERAKQRMDWIGRTMSALEFTSPKSSPIPSVMRSPARASSSRPSSGSFSGGRPSSSRPSTGTNYTTPSPALSRPRSSRKRSYTDEEASSPRSAKKKKVKMQLACSPDCTRHDHDHEQDEDRPGSSESSSPSVRSARSGMDALADAAVEAAREQLQRL